MSLQRNISPPPSKRRRLDGPIPKLAETLPNRSITNLQDGWIRIFTWNVNGISPFLQKSIRSFFKPSSRGGGQELQSERNGISSSHSRSRSRSQSPNLRDCLRRWGWPQVLCLQEIKVAPGDTKTLTSIQRAVKSPSGEEPSYEAFFCLPRDKYNAKGFGGKVYGVCTIVRADLLANQSADDKPARVEPVSWDLEGRVLALVLQASRLLVLNVYAVNGTDNPYRCPDSGEVTGTRHDFKKAFHSRLREEVSQYEQDGWSVVVAGDLNIARHPIDGFPGIRLASDHVENRRDFETKFMKPISEGGLGMCDSFRSLHGQEKKYTYRSPNIPWGASCDRVDLVLLSSVLVKEGPILLEADILDDEGERSSSDHLPSYVTLDVARIESIARPTSRSNLKVSKS